MMYDDPNLVYKQEPTQKNQVPVKPPNYQTWK